MEESTSIDADIVEEAEEEVKVPIPDDPGVDKDEEKSADKRFRLF